MIYYNDELIQWDGKKEYSQIEQEVREEILEIQNKYFGNKTMGRLRLLYPKGEPKMEHGGGFEVLKIFPIPLLSADGQWRYSKTRRTAKGYPEHYMNIKHKDVFGIKDIEFVWFLLNRSVTLNKYVFIEDLEGDAKKKMEDISTMADIQYALTGKKSPIAKNEFLIREVATIFNIKNVDKIGINQVKEKLMDALKEGEEMNDAFINFKKFDEFTDGDATRKIASIARSAINDREVAYKDRAWWIMSGRSYEEKLMDVLPKDAAYKDQVFVDEIINNPNTRSRLFTAIGKEEGITLNDLRSMDRPVLQKKYKELTGKFENTKKEEIVKLLCDELKIEYTE